jgi:hypothetical protein
MRENDAISTRILLGTDIRNWARKSTARTMSPMLRGLAVVWPQAVPAAGEDGAAAFTEAARCSQLAVVGAVVEVQALARQRTARRNVDALAGALMSAVGKHRQVLMRGGLRYGAPAMAWGKDCDARGGGRAPRYPRVRHPAGSVGPAFTPAYGP